MNDFNKSALNKLANGWSYGLSPDAKGLEIRIGHRKIPVIDAAVSGVLDLYSIEATPRSIGQVSNGLAFQHLNTVRNELTGDKRSLPRHVISPPQIF